MKKMCRVIKADEFSETESKGNLGVSLGNEK
jgi:hypothetical protein